MKKILIIQTAYIGDVILATALVDQVRASYPKAQIDFVLRRGNESLLLDHPNVNRIYIWDKKNKFKSLFQIIRDIRKTRYDLLLNVQRFFNAGLIGLCAKAKTKICFNKNPLSLFYTKVVVHNIPDQAQGEEFRHEVERNAKLLRVYNNTPLTRIRPSLFFNNDEKNKIKELVKQSTYYVLAPSSVWFTKQLPKEKWIELLKRLDHTPYLIGGPDDREYLDQIIKSAKKGVNLAGKLSLKESALLMQNAKRVFVNDSAPLHLASSVNAKTTAFFCSTIPEFGYGPLSDQSIIIESSPRQACSPCGLHGKKQCPLGHFKCGLDIDIQSVQIN